MPNTAETRRGNYHCMDDYFCDLLYGMMWYSSHELHLYNYTAILWYFQVFTQKNIIVQFTKHCNNMEICKNDFLTMMFCVP
jgi:hypothetical protein